jgi:hypothetical protein
MPFGKCKTLSVEEKSSGKWFDASRIFHRKTRFLLQGEKKRGYIRAPSLRISRNHSH